eukprot:2543843-Rhodomonas_salina.2
MSGIDIAYGATRMENGRDYWSPTPGTKRCMRFTTTQATTAHWPKYAPLSSYALAMYVRYWHNLGLCCATRFLCMSGTGIAEGAIVLRACYACPCVWCQCLENTPDVTACNSQISKAWEQEGVQFASRK